MHTKGKFIVFEGTDGSGKTTQMSLLGEYLKNKGIACELTREPTTSPFGQLLRDCLKCKLDTGEDTIAALFAADRLDHIRSMRAALERGVTVLCDRYYFSSFAYNGGFVSLDWVIELNRLAMQEFPPDLVIYLDLTPEESMARVGEREEKERYETLEKQSKIRAKYFEVFEKVGGNIAIVKSEAEKLGTQEKVRAAAEKLFKA